jgi:hypothetical protein
VVAAIIVSRTQDPETTHRSAEPILVPWVGGQCWQAERTARARQRSVEYKINISAQNPDSKLCVNTTHWLTEFASRLSSKETFSPLVPNFVVNTRMKLRTNSDAYCSTGYCDAHTNSIIRSSRNEFATIYIYIYIYIIYTHPLVRQDRVKFSQNCRELTQLSVRHVCSTPASSLANCLDHTIRLACCGFDLCHKYILYLYLYFRRRHDLPEQRVMRLVRRIHLPRELRHERLVRKRMAAVDDTVALHYARRL